MPLSNIRNTGGQVEYPTGRSHDQPLDLGGMWLETDGLGGYACTTVSGILNHRSQGLVVAAMNPPYDRYVLVNTFDVRVAKNGQEFPLSSHAFGSGIIRPNGRENIHDFRSKPWPTWFYELENGIGIEHELFIRRGMPVFVFSWKLARPAEGVELRLRPLLSARRIDRVQKRNEAFCFDVKIDQRKHSVRPHDDAPAVAMITEAEFEADPRWHIGFGYEEDIKPNGSVATEDLASPGVFTWNLSAGRASLIIAPDDALEAHHISLSEPPTTSTRLRKAETMRRSLFRNEVERTTDAYIVTRKSDDSLQIMPGYPVSTRRLADGLVALRGICLSPGRLELAQKVLLGLRQNFSDGLLPNVYSEHGARQVARSDSPDATLWYMIVVHELGEASKRLSRSLDEEALAAFRETISHSLTKFQNGTAPGVVINQDGLLCSASLHASGNTGPAAVFNVATQALWINALRIASKNDPKLSGLYRSALEAFGDSFWYEEGGYLYDTISARETDKPTLKARQILAVGGLPVSIIDEARASLIVQLLEDELVGPDGLHLAEEGAPEFRQTSSFLMGPFIEAWYRIHRSDEEEEALWQIESHYLAAWQEQLQFRGLEHLGDISENPGVPSVPFSAPATSELVRILHLGDFEDEDNPFADVTP